ncbi:MAG TPA: hypothetical protein VKV04_06130 [Verrucomicrobiae bacterium]|nr:hypothetical protein [Verrucomicrobiae bacterium]
MDSKLILAPCGGPPLAEGHRVRAGLAKRGILPGGNNCVRLFQVIGLLALMNLGNALPAVAQSPEDRIATLKKEKDDAFSRIQDIVNQPVTPLKRTPDMVVKNFTDWGKHDFLTPDFDTVDVRRSQQNMFDGYQYVTCDLNPGEAFIGSELEFNEMTKIFYTDFTVPKKKLTEAEMLEINQLCRVIGNCSRQLDELESQEPPLTKVHQLLLAHKPIVIGAVALLVLAFYFVRKRQAQRTEV